MKKQYSSKSRYWEKKRFIISNLLNKLKIFCWADLAMFGMGYGIKYLFKTSNGCKRESLTHDCKNCYCGKFYKGRLATKEDFQNNKSDLNELPF